MASIDTLYGKDGKPRAYKVRWRGDDGKEVARTVKRKRDADALKTTMEGAKLEGVVPGIGNGNVTVRAYVEEWLDGQTHRATTKARATRVLSTLVALYPERRVASIGQTDVKRWIKVRSAAVSGATVATEWTWIRALFASAVADGIRRTSPCSGVSLPKSAPAPPIVIPSYEELDALTAALPDRLAALLWVGARTGLRPGELRGLTVGQVDFMRKTVTVDRQADPLGRIVALDPLTGAELGPVEPKTDSSHRTVPVDQATVAIIAEHLAAYGPGEPGDLVFARETGGAHSASALAGAWKRGGRKAGLPRGITPHTGRHYYASALIAAGCGPLVVKERLGHAKLGETMDTYGHLFPAEDDRTRTAIADHFERARIEARSIRGLSANDQASDQGF